MEILTIAEILLKLLLASLLGAVCGKLSYFIDYTFWKGSIFQNYLPWLAKVNLKRFRPETYKEILLLKEDQRGDIMIAEAEKCFFFKMLGGCSVCFNMWISMLTFSILCYFVPFIEWYYCFPYVLTASWYIRKLVGAVYK